MPTRDTPLDRNAHEYGLLRGVDDNDWTEPDDGLQARIQAAIDWRQTPEGLRHTAGAPTRLQTMLDGPELDQLAGDLGAGRNGPMADDYFRALLYHCIGRQRFELTVMATITLLAHDVVWADLGDAPEAAGRALARLDQEQPIEPLRPVGRSRWALLDTSAN